MFKLNMN